MREAETVSCSTSAPLSGAVLAACARAEVTEAVANNAALALPSMNLCNNLSITTNPLHFELRSIRIAFRSSETAPPRGPRSCDFRRDFGHRAIVWCGAHACGRFGQSLFEQRRTPNAFRH